MSHPGISRRRRSLAAVETIERRILLSGNITQLADFGTYDVTQGATVVDSRGDIFGTTLANNGAYGTLFELPAGENTIHTIVTFSGNNGSDPGSFLAIDSSGNVYGTTSAGGQDGDGIIWELPASATNITRLVSYNGTDGNQLGNGLTLDANGNIYVIGEAGTNGYGAILELPAGSTSLSVIATFASGDDPVGRPVVDQAGDVFAVTAAGGIDGLGSLDELTANRGLFNTNISFTATNPTPQGDLLIDSAGDIFGTTVSTSNNQTTSTTYEVPDNSLVITTLQTQTSFNGSYFEPGLVRDSEGNLFGSAVGATGAPSTVYKIPIVGGAYSSAVTLATVPEVDNQGVNVNDATGFLALDASGDLYGTTQSTAPGTDDTLFEIPGAGVAQVGSQLVISQQPTQTIVDEEITPSVTVDVEDSNNNLVPSNDSPVSIRINSGPTGAVLGGTLTVDAVDGVATFSNLNLNTTGTYTFSFTAPGMSSDTTNSFKIIPSPLDGSHLVFTLPPTTSTVAGTKLQEFIVSAEEPSDAISTKTKGTVTLSITSGPTNGKILGTKTAPLQKGIATFKKVSFDIAGAYTLEATDTASIAATPQTFSITATTPKKMIFSQQPAAKIATDQTFTVSLETLDKYGNLATQDVSSVTLLLSGGPKLAGLGGTTTENIVDGIAAFDDLSIITLGHYVLKASDPADNLKVTSKGFKIT